MAREGTIDTRTSVLPGEWRAFRGTGTDGTSHSLPRRTVASPSTWLAGIAAMPASKTCPALPGGPGDDTWSSVRALRAARAVPARRVGRRRGARHARQPRLDPAAGRTGHLALGVLLEGRGGHGVQARVGPQRLASAALRGHGRALRHRRGRALQLHPGTGHLPRRHRHPRRHPDPGGPPARGPDPLAARETDLEAELAKLLGKPWDDELEPFRYAGEGAPVRWLHQVV